MCAGLLAFQTVITNSHDIVHTATLFIEGYRNT